MTRPIPHEQWRAASVRFKLAAALVALLASGCSSSEEGGGAAANGRPGADERPPPGVRVVSAEQRPVARLVEFTGELVAEDMVAVSPYESGRLERLEVDEGDVVEAGQLIGELDSELQRMRQREAEARLDTARAREDQAEAQREQQANEVARRRPLAERNAFPEAELAQLEDQVAVADEAVALADAQVDEARAAVAAARAELERRQIRAPMSGVVIERHASPGDIVSPQAPVVTMVDERSLHFVFPLSEQRLELVVPGTRASIRLDAYPSRRFEAAVWRVGRIVDRESRTVDVKLTVEADGTSLFHGMFGRGELVAEQVDDGVVIPPEALQTDRDGATQVWQVVDGAAQQVPVTVRLATEDAIAVSGLEPGATVIVSPPMGLVPGGPVYVVGGGPTSATGPADGTGAPLGRREP